jgi:hypothetical protein
MEAGFYNAEHKLSLTLVSLCDIIPNICKYLINNDIINLISSNKHFQKIKHTIFILVNMENYKYDKNKDNYLNEANKFNILRKIIHIQKMKLYKIKIINTNNVDLFQKEININHIIFSNDFSYDISELSDSVSTIEFVGKHIGKINLEKSKVKKIIFHDNCNIHELYNIENYINVQGNIIKIKAKSLYCPFCVLLNIKKYNYPKLKI